MKEKRIYLVFRDCLKRNRAALLLLIFSLSVNGAVFCLYDVMTEPLLYAFAVSAAFFFVLFAIGFVKEYRRAKSMEAVSSASWIDLSLLPEPQHLTEQSYREMLFRLRDMLEKAGAEYQEERQDMLDYYTAWIHQIKTPIAVMKLKLGDTDRDREISEELFRVEQYVDMVLQYIRLGSGAKDLVVREYSIDEMIRETIRKYAPQFVGKRLKLQYEPTAKTIVTDRKWFCCILEQFISNAIKYTPTGTIEIKVEENRLMISDTGIGILPEDLPRVFEKGYTGLNGRIGQQSSGLGLYLAKKAADLIHIPISAESRAGEGSSFCMDITQKAGF